MLVSLTGLAVGKDFVRRLLEFNPKQRLTLQMAESHPWLKNHKHAYEIKYPDDLSPEDSLARTASLGSGGSKTNPVEPPARAVQMRAATVDPYADDDDVPLTRAVTVDPYADDDPYPPAAATRLEPIPEVGHLERRSDVLERAETSGANLIPGMQYQSHSQESRYIYGAPSAAPALASVPPPGLVATSVETRGADRGAQKRTFAEMHTANSSPLSSAGSPSPAQKKGKTTKSGSAGSQPPGNVAASSSSRKAKGKAKEKPEVTKVTATRKSNRPARR